MHNTAHSLVRQKHARPSSTHVDAPPHQSNHLTELERLGSRRAAYSSELNGGKSVATSTPLVGIVWDHLTVPHLPPQPLCSAAVLDAQIMSQSIFAHRIVEMWLACRDDGRDGPVESCEVPGRNQHPPGRSTSEASSTHHTASTPCTLSAPFELSRKLWVLCFGQQSGRALVANRYSGYSGYSGYSQRAADQSRLPPTHTQARKRDGCADGAGGV